MLYAKYGMVFFLLTIIASCKNHSQKIALVWKNHRAVAIQIPLSLITSDQSLHPLKVTLLSNTKGNGILGDFKADGDVVEFTPLIPLSPGLGYTILQDGKTIGGINVPMDKNEQAPTLLTVYPEKDILPENLLKFYLKFSKPMRSGKALDYINLLDKNKDTLRNVFLNLQPELWDTSGTVLTVWIDPGRIKRGLVLNRELGNPLKKAENYQLVVSQKWKDTHGLTLSKSFTKQFVAGSRDEQTPDITTWQLQLPKAGTTTPLTVNIPESLDHYLLQESVIIIDANGKPVDGTTRTGNKDRQWQFTPVSSWKAQAYKLRVKGKLEDLTGNNLNRVFDRDITKDKQRNQEYYERGFEVKN